MREVTLRSPFPAEDVPRIWTWMEPFRWRVSDDFSPKTLQEFIPYFREMEARGKSWGVYRGGELGGAISYEQVSPIVGTAHCVFKKAFWGRATTAAAITASLREMFERCEKLSLPVMEGNKAMLSLLTGIGATKEGVLKAHSRRDGKPIDIALMAFFRPVEPQKESA